MVTIEAAERMIREVMQSKPELTDFGFGVSRLDPLSADERQHEFEIERAKLLLPQSLAQFGRAYDWLSRWDKRRTLNKFGGSYRLKHVAAHDIGHVTNGVFIAAAVSAGFEVKRMYGGPNACLNITKYAFYSARRKALIIEQQSARSARRAIDRIHLLHDGACSR